jgi:hypothetical protein
LWLQLACHTLLESGLARWQPWLVCGPRCGWTVLVHGVDIHTYVVVVMVRCCYISTGLYAENKDWGIQSEGGISPVFGIQYFGLESGCWWPLRIEVHSL